MTYREKLLDPRWQKKRLYVLERDEFACQYCGDTEKALHVHHLAYSDTRNPWDVEYVSLITLCSDCHKIEHLNIGGVLRDLLIYLTEHTMAGGNRQFKKNVNDIILSYSPEKITHG